MEEPPTPPLVNTDGTLAELPERESWPIPCSSAEFDAPRSAVGIDVVLRTGVCAGNHVIGDVELVAAWRQMSQLARPTDVVGADGIVPPHRSRRRRG